MKKFISPASLLCRVQGSGFLFVLYSLLVTGLLFLYRLEIHGLIEEIYGNLQLSFLHYLAMSFPFDAAVFLILSLLLLMALMFLPGRWRYLGAGLIIFSLGMGLLLGIEFFRVYETTFQTSFWTDENSTAIGEMIHSYFAEASFGFYWKNIVLGIFLILLSAILRSPRLPLSEFFEGDMPRKYTLSVLALLLVILVSLPLMIPSPPQGEKDQTRALQLWELSLHPVYNLISDIDDVSPSATHLSGSEGDMKSFTPGLSTMSITSPTRHRRINAIPRGKKYNIILYFFESTPARYVDQKINGKWIMPQWRKLMKHSIVSSNHYANYPLSANALLSVLTSAYDMPTRELVIQKYSSVKLKTMPEILKSEGYRTCIIHTGDLRYAGQRRFLKKRGLDRIIDYPELKDIPPYNYKVGWGVDERAMIEPTVRFMKENREKPFFVT